MNDAQMSELLDRVTPSYDERAGDWAAIVQDARRRRSPRRPLRVGLAFAAAAAAAALAVLAWPFQTQQGGVLERALAAIGDGPVLHVVMRDELGNTLVDLSTGARRTVYGETEIWYDTERGLVHSIARLGGVTQHEQVYEPKQPPPELTALAREYREALESGTARVAGEGSVDGEPVTWITIRSELLPDVADGKDHEWEQQVAVSRRTFEPVALRETRDGEPGPGTLRRVLALELLPAGAGDFSASERETLDRRAFRQGREPIALEQARATLGRTPLWLGREHAALPLARVLRETTATGRQREVRIEWEEEQTALVLFYGTVADDPTTYRDDLVPRWDLPHVTITQSTEARRFSPGAGRYVPPDGSVFVAAGGRAGLLRTDGLWVSIEAQDEQAIVTAARALQAMP